jgi:hypothetical protein
VILSFLKRECERLPLFFQKALLRSGSKFIDVPDKETKIQRSWPFELSMSLFKRFRSFVTFLRQETVIKRSGTVIGGQERSGKMDGLKRLCCT